MVDDEVKEDFQSPLVASLNDGFHVRDISIVCKGLLVVADVVACNASDALVLC